MGCFRPIAAVECWLMMLQRGSPEETLAARKLIAAANGPKPLFPSEKLRYEKRNIPD